MNVSVKGCMIKASSIGAPVRVPEPPPEEPKSVTEICAELEAQAGEKGPFAAIRLAKAIASLYGIEFDQMISDRRSKHLVVPRQHAMWAIREYTKLSLPAIGRVLGGRDHTTVLHGCRQHERRMRGEIL